MLNVNELAPILREELTKNPTFNAVMHVFALRNRARNIVTVSSLHHKMKKEGFVYPKEEYAAVLRSLSNLGLGKLDIDLKGRVRALKDIKVTLQSIGEVACGKDKSLKSFRARNKFLRMSPQIVEASAPPTNHKTTVAPIKDMTVDIKVNINGSIISIPVPKDLGAAELVILIDSLRRARSA